MQDYQKSESDIKTEEKLNESLIKNIENSFDWNLIAIVSVFLFLFATHFLIYM